MTEKIRSGDDKTSFFLFIIVVAGFFIVMLDATVVNVALTSIGKSLHASNSGLQWIVNSYTLSLASTLLAWGSLCDKFGAHRIYTIGLILFALASISCGFANETRQLLIARLVQGLGGACLIPASLSLVSHLAKNAKQRARFIGYWGASGGLAAATGPLLGGTLTTHFGWSSIFFINIPIIIILLLCLFYHWKTLNQVIELKINQFDWAGCLLMTLVMTACSFAIIQGADKGGILVWAAIVLGVMALLVFIWHEYHHQYPLLPLSLIKQRAFIHANIVGFCLNFSFFGELFILSLYLQQHLQLTSGQTGIALFPQTCSAIIAAPLGGRCASQWGNKKAMQAGLLIGGTGFTLLNLIDKNLPFTIIAIFSFLASFGMAFAMPAATNQAISCVKHSEQGIASGVINTTRQFGTVMGVALIGSLYSITGVHIAFTTAALMFFLPLMLISFPKNR